MLKVTARLLSLCILLCSLKAFALPDFAKAVHYTAPPTYGCFELNHDPGDNPFSGDGPVTCFWPTTKMAR